MTIEVGKTYNTWDERHTFKVLCVGEHRAFGIQSVRAFVKCHWDILICVVKHHKN